MPRLSRMVFALLMAAILTTTATLADSSQGARPRRIEIAAAAPLDLAARLWSLLARTWTKNGSQADPNGLPVKNGSMIEPDGNKLQTPVPAATNGDNGHQVDPDG
jgi:hypothetical protein